MGSDTHTVVSAPGARGDATAGTPGHDGERSGQPRERSGQPRERSDARALYTIACDPEAALPGALAADLRTELTGAAAGSPRSLDDLTAEARSWAAGEASRYRDLVAGVADPGTREVLARRAALGCAPLGILAGAWLQWASAPGNADDDVTLRVLGLYASDVGVGAPRASRGSAYLALLGHLRLAEHAAPAASLTLDRRVADRAFHLPAVLVAAGRRPDDLLAEILGADACLRAVGLLPALAAVREVHPSAGDWEAIDLASARGGAAGTVPAGERVAAAIHALAGRAGEEALRRVTQGFAWALTTLGGWSEALHRELEAARDPAFEMAELVRARAREGAVYHHGFMLEGRPLSAWLREARTDPAPLLAALARSRLVKPGRAHASPLTTGLIGERGPMFRVFSPADEDVIRRWIDALPETGTAAPPAAVGPGRVAPLALPALGAPLEEGHEPADLREAYHLLQTRQSTASLRRFALAYVAGWLRRSRHGIDRGGLPLPRRWDREGLRPWLLEQHDRHDREFEDGREASLPSREELIDSTVQLAPLTLIDGSWLQGFTDYELASSEIGHFLFETYWDELGNGELRLNHPLLYREVLDEMGVHLPPTASPEFARWPGFRDRSFELPVYWLCIGRFPRTFTPEVLGLNLAMELSGVGGSYRRAHVALREYGYSTRFVDIHNTIDNVATGHSAWAADAVDTFMASVPDARGPDGRAHVWERVRAGYRSLSPPDGRRARRAGRRARRAAARRRQASHARSHHG